MARAVAEGSCMTMRDDGCLFCGHGFMVGSAARRIPAEIRKALRRKINNGREIVEEMKLQAGLVLRGDSDRSTFG